MRCIALRIFCFLCISLQASFISAHEMSEYDTDLFLSVELEQLDTAFYKKNIKIEKLIKSPSNHWRSEANSQPFQGIFETDWFRARVTNDSDETSYQLLEFRNALNKPFHLFTVQKNSKTGQLEVQSINDIYAVLNSSIIVPLNLKPKKSVWVYMHIESSRFRPISVMLWDNQNSLEHIQKTSSFEGMAMGIIIALGCSSLLIMISVRSISYVYYTLLTFAMCFLYSSSTGLIVYKVLGLPLPVLLIPLCFIMFAFFTQRTLRIKKRMGKIYFIKDIVVGLSIVQLLLYLFVHQTVRVYFVTGSIILSIGLMLSVGIYAVKVKRDGALLYVCGWLFFLMSLAVIGILYMNNTLKNSHIILINGTIITLLWWKALLIERLQRGRIRYGKVQQQALDQQKHLQVVQEAALKAEEQANQKLEQLILQRTQKLEQTMQELNMVNEKLSEQATLDALTNVKNKRAFDEYLYTEALQSQRDKMPLSLIMIDLDKFKKINDSFGHLAGDHVLKRTAGVIASCISRPRDMVARFGGEEFAVVLPNTHKEGALYLAENMRKALEELEIFWDSRRIQVTASFGVSTTIMKDSADIYHLIDVADQALYQAKGKGRNQVCFDEFRTY